MRWKPKYTGNFKSFPFPNLLRFLVAQGETGALLLARDKVEKVAYFRAGRVVYLSSTLARESFLRGVVTRARLSRTAAAALADRALSLSGPPEKTASEEHVLADSQIASVSAEVQKARLMDLFEWRQGEFAFCFGADPPPGRGGTFPDHPIDGLICQGLRDHLDGGRIRSAFVSRMQHVVRPVPGIGVRMGGLGLTAAEMGIARLVDGTRTVERIRDHSGSTPKKTLWVLFVLELFELIELVDPKQEPPAAPPPGGAGEDRPLDVMEYTALIDREYERLRAENYFRLFGIEGGLDEEQIRRAYYSLARKYRPDELYVRAAPQVQRRADAIFDYLSDGYEALLDLARGSRGGPWPDPAGACARIETEEATRVRGEKHFLAGREAMDAGNAAAARHELDQCVRACDKEGEYWAYLGIIEYRTANSGADRERAAVYLKRALARDSYCIPALAYSAEVAEAAGDLGAALKHVRRALGLKPGSAKLRRRFKRLEGLAGDSGALEEKRREEAGAAQKARAFIEKAAGANYYAILGVGRNATDSDVRHAYFRLAKDFHPDRIAADTTDEAEQQAVEDAFQLINEAYQTLSSAQRRVAYDSGQSLRKQEAEIRKAKTRKAIEETQVRGRNAIREGNLDAAREAFRSVLDREPDNALALAGLAYAEYCVGAAQNGSALRDAEELFERAARLAPRQDDVYFLWGLMYKRSGNQIQARNRFQQAVEVNRTSTEALREIRIMNMRSGERDGADKGLLGGLGLKKK